MKIIAFDRDGFASVPNSLTPVHIIPDSAMVLKGRPVFVPDFGSGWKARPMLALRLGRLGRDISRKFASRYVDAVTVAMRLILPDGESHASSGLLDALDSSLAMGEWLPVDSLENHELRLSANGADAVTADLDSEIENCISLASGFMTLKTGDIILAAAIADDMEAIPGASFCASIGDNATTNLRFV